MKHFSNHAYWEQRTHLFREDEYICSCCGYVADSDYSQCPCCQAIMGNSEYNPNWVDEAEILDIILDD